MHKRIPVIVHANDYELWLSLESQVDDLKGLLKPFDAEMMQEHYVTPRMNNPRFEGPECIQPVAL